MKDSEVQLKEALDKQKQLCLDILEKVRGQVERGELISLFLEAETPTGSVVIETTPFLFPFSVVGAGVSALQLIGQAATTVGHAPGGPKGKDLN